MRVSTFAFVVAALAGLTGMSLGLYMGLDRDFTLAPAHAHVNLLGWVTMMLYGLYHRGVERADDRLAWSQVGAGALGFPLMTGAMAAILTAGAYWLVPVALAGAGFCIGSMLLFLAVLRSDAAGRRPEARALPA